MKKLIALSAMLFSIVAIAGPKADIQKADELLSKNKVEEAINLLKKTRNVKGEEKEYEDINLFLARQAKTKDEAISYLKKASENPNSIQAIIELVNLSEKNKDKIKYLEILITKPNQNTVDIIAKLAALYKAENENSKFNELVKKVEAEKREDVTDNFNAILGQSLLILNKESEGISYLNKAFNSKFENVKSDVYLTYADYYALKKDAKKVAQYLNAASVDKEKYLLIAQKFVNILSDYKTAYSYVQKAYNLEPSNNELLHQVFIFSVINKDTSAESKYANLIKKNEKNIGIAQLLLNHRLFEASEKYAKLALNDKAKEADLILALVYGYTNKIDLAITHAKKAVSNKVTGAQNLLTQLENAKKNQK